MGPLPVVREGTASLRTQRTGNLWVQGHSGRLGRCECKGTKVVAAPMDVAV